MSTFGNRLALGMARAKEHAGDACTIHRHGETGTSTAILARTSFQAHEEESTTTRQHVQDLLVDVADYNVAGTLTEPRSGDEYTMTIGTTARRFECRTPPGFETPWSYSDQNRSRYRIHVIEISNP